MWLNSRGASRWVASTTSRAKSPQGFNPLGEPPHILARGKSVPNPAVCERRLRFCGLGRSRAAGRNHLTPCSAPATLIAEMFSLRPRVKRSLFPGIALATLFVATQLTGLTHLIMVRHVTCPDHGELVHSEGPTLASPGDALRTPPGTSYRAAPRQADSHGHDHCLVSLSRREQLSAPVATTTLTIAYPWPESAPVERVGSRAAGAALLRLAPKSSPPA